MSEAESIEPGSVSVRVLLQAYTRIGRDWEGLSLHSEFWRLYCNESPGASLVDGPRRFALGPDRLFLVPPRFQGRTHVTGLVGHFYLHFDLPSLPQGLVGMLFPQPLRVPITPWIETLRRRWMADLRVPKTAPSLPDLLRAQSLAAECFAACWEEESVSESTTWRAWQERSPRLAAIQPWMATRLDQDLSVATLARQSGYSTDHFRRIFFSVFGMKPAAYVSHLRTKEAARRLLYTDESLEQIAESTGFVDRHHLSRIFRRHTRESPAAYRRKHRAAAKPA